MPPRLLFLALSSLPLLQLSLAALDMKACSDGSCSSGCTSWSKDSGSCSPGTSSSAWISSIVTKSEDGKTATWSMYQDSASRQDCSGTMVLSIPNLKADGSCNTLSPSLSITINESPAGIIIGVVVGVVALGATIGTLCCWHRGSCCFANCPRGGKKPASPIHSPAVVATSYGGPPPGVPQYGMQPPQPGYGGMMPPPPGYGMMPPSQPGHMMPPPQDYVPAKAI
jgi:hypothetical protein